MGSPLRVSVRGPLEPFAGGFAAELESLGYRPNAAANLLQLMAHLSRWLDAQDLGVAAASPALTGRFLADRRAAGYRLWLSPRALRPMLCFLRRSRRWRRRRRCRRRRRRRWSLLSSAT